MDLKKKNGKRRRGARKSDEGKNSNSQQTTSSELQNEGVETNYQDRGSVLIQLNEEEPTWYEYGKTLPNRNSTLATTNPQTTNGKKSDQLRMTRGLVSKYRAMADTLVQKEIQVFDRTSTRGSDERWVEKTIKKGTLKDRIAAMSVTVGADPVHKFFTIDGLLQMTGCTESGGQTNSRVAQLASEALEDLFQNTLLPPDRKLIPLDNRPLYLYEMNNGGKEGTKASKKTLSPRILFLWRFEELVKEKYDLFLRKYLAHTLHEGVEAHKISAIRSAAKLLRSIPEGEAELLAMIANKLGDPGKKTAAAAGHELRRVLQQHPNMQPIVAREVQQLAHRPHLSPKALYNCIVFLNQLKLQKEDDDATKSESKSGFQQSLSLPVSLVKTYFRLFEVAVIKAKNNESTEEGMKSRLLSALLTGVNRAHPYLDEKDQDMVEHVDTLYRVVHTAPPSTCTQALMLLFHVTIGSQHDNNESFPDSDKKSANDESSTNDRQGHQKDRFYRALYATLSQPALLSSGKHLTMYFNLLYKAMKSDTNPNRINAFAKRILCTTIHCNPAAVSGSLFLINEIAKTQEELRKCIEELPGGRDAMTILDPSKREPRAALIYRDGKVGESDRKADMDDDIVKHPACWELALLSHHFHPSVSKFSSNIGEISYTGDPLKDFGLAPFLDRFAYRNPKSSEKTTKNGRQGHSIAERRSGTESTMQARRSLPVNDPSFLEKEDVNEQDEFFRKFFLERARRDELKGIVRHKPTPLDEDEVEDAEDEALDAAEEAEGFAHAQQSFEAYEQAWESDPEEEAFVDALAQSLMDDAEDGIADLDDEDPDLDDWGDIYAVDEGDDSEANANDDENNVADVDGDDFDEKNIMDDEDAFMDDDNSDERNSDADSTEDHVGSGVPFSSKNDDGDSEGEAGEDDDDDEDLHLLLRGSDSDDQSVSDDEEESSEPIKQSQSKKRKEMKESTFADAADFEEMIDQGWAEMKSTKESNPEGETNEAPKKKRRKGKRKKHQ